MPTTAFLAPPRLAAALITTLLILFCVLADTAHAAPTDFCSPGVTTTFKGGGNWGDGDNWTDGQPDAYCDAVIPANTTVTLSTTVDHYGNEAAGSAEGLTIGPGATVVVEGVSSTVIGNWSNATSLYVDGDGLTIDKGATLDLEATGNNAPGFTAVAPSQPGGSANVQVDSYSTAPTSFINDGTINATSSGGGWGESLNVAGTLVNAGNINDESGKLTFQGQNLPYLVNNTGSLSIASGGSFTMIAGDGSSFNNTGTFANQGTATLQQSMHWVQSAGSETGNPVQLTGPEVLQDSAGTGSFEVTNCTVAGLTGTIPAGQTVTVNGECSGTTLNLGTSSDTATVVNDGTLVLNAPAGGSDGILQGSELDNHGTLDSTVAGPLPLANQLLDPLVNEKGATVNVTGGELAQTNGTTTANAGTVNIGAGATWLVQGGAFTNKGTLSPKVGGTKSLGTVNLTVGSKFTAGGKLAPDLISGYKPKAGTEFPFITYNGGSVSRTFASVTGGFAADYKKETASPAYVGLIYGRGAAATAATKLTVKVRCPASAKHCESYSASVTVTEKLRGKTKSVTVGSKSGKLKVGKSATVTLKLNGTGAKLLKQTHKLKVFLIVKSGGKVIAKKTVTLTA
jgi:hypothetical protein